MALTGWRRSLHLAAGERGRLVGRRRYTRADGEDRADYRHDRPGRLVPGGAPAREGLRGPRHGAALEQQRTFERIAHLRDRLELLQGDLLDQLADHRARSRPDEVYNLAAQRFVPRLGPAVLTGEFTGLGVTRMLDAIRRSTEDPLLPGLSSARCSARSARPRRPRRRRSTRAARTASPSSTATG